MCAGISTERKEPKWIVGRKGETEKGERNMEDKKSCPCTVRDDEMKCLTRF